MAPAVEEGQVARVGERRRDRAMRAQRVRCPLRVGLRHQRVHRATQHDSRGRDFVRGRHQLIAAALQAAPEGREGRHRRGIIVACALLASP